MISILAVAELCEPTVWGLCSPASLTTQQVTFMKKYLKKTKTRAPQYHFRAVLLLQQTKQTLFDSRIRLQSRRPCDAMAVRYLCHTQPALLIGEAEPLVSNTSGRVSC